MGLIQCPDCKKQVSDRADACPNCGCPPTAPPNPTTHPASTNTDDTTKPAPVKRSKDGGPPEDDGNGDLTKEALRACREKLDSMTPEERSNLQRNFSRKFGGTPDPIQPPSPPFDPTNYGHRWFSRVGCGAVMILGPLLVLVIFPDAKDVELKNRGSMPWTFFALTVYYFWFVIRGWKEI